jgi:menaquinone-dependent protoporphyrinogen oxidase
MRVLVAWCSKRGGTAGIAHVIGESLRGSGLDVTELPIDKVSRPGAFEAAIIGGALYANRWPSTLRRFVNCHAGELRKMPVWLFSSGPLDDSADNRQIPAPVQIAALAERIGAQDHVTFGGRLEPSAKGFPAAAMAKTRSGDWRNFEQIRAWASRIAAELPQAVPGHATDLPGRSVWRLLAHAVAGWVLLGGLEVLSLNLLSQAAALAIQAIAAPLLFIGIARHYFHARGAREAASVAIVWTSTVAVLDLAVIAGVGQLNLARDLRMWVPLALIFIAVRVTGEVVSMMPQPGAPACAGTSGSAH